jgi:hypothetical protein
MEITMGRRRRLSGRRVAPPDIEPLPEPVPVAPPPLARTAEQGIETARSRARLFLPNADLLAAIAFGANSECALHTELMACKELVSLAGAIPTPMPTTPTPPPLPYEGADGRREPV